MTNTQKPGVVNAAGSGGIVNKASVFRPLAPDRFAGEGSCTITRRGGESEVLARESGEGNWRRPYYEQARSDETPSKKAAAEQPGPTAFVSDEDTFRSVANPRGEGGMQYFGGEGEGMAKRADQMPTA